MSITHTSVSSARSRRVASICHRSLGDDRSKRWVARAQGDQVVAHQGSVDRRDRWRVDALALELASDAPGPPLGVVLSHLGDLLFDVGRHPLGLVEGLARPGLEPFDPLGSESAQVDVVGLPGDLESFANGRDSLTTTSGLQQDL
jgi:hypothetical protein